jgi:hypothetical protein
MNKQLGMNPRLAAEAAAKVHADYADVPAVLRKKLNRWFFTPTFFLSMFKVQSEMAGQLIKSAARVATVGHVKQDSQQRALAMGAFVTLAALSGVDEWLTRMWGYERDQWGRKYTRVVDLPDGGETTRVINLASPLNKMVKYWYWAAAVGAVGETNKLQSMLSRLKWESTPVIRIGLQAIENRQGNGLQIRYFSDSGPKQAVDTVTWGLREVFKMIDVLKVFRAGKVYPKLSPDDNAAMIADMENTFKVLEALSIVFVSSRKPKDRIVAAKIRNIVSQTRKDVLELFTTEGEMDEERLEEWVERLEKRAEILQEGLD